MNITTRGLAVLASFLSVNLVAQTDAKVDFARDVQPLLRTHSGRAEKRGGLGPATC